jgi:hypothetical protein
MRQAIAERFLADTPKIVYTTFSGGIESQSLARIFQGIAAATQGGLRSFTCYFNPLGVSFPMVSLSTISFARVQLNSTFTILARFNQSPFLATWEPPIGTPVSKPAL